MSQFSSTLDVPPRRELVLQFLPTVPVQEEPQVQSDLVGILDGDWGFYEGVDSPRNNLEDLDCQPNLFHLEKLKDKCFELGCVAFNSNGDLKQRLLPKKDWVKLENWDGSLRITKCGLWVKTMDPSIELKRFIVGQTDAVRVVSATIQKWRAGWLDEGSPPVFLFLGSSGVGKTEMAKRMAAIVHPENEDGLIRFDMSEYQQKHDVQKFIGAPPGYIGCERGGQLTKKLLNKPDSVVLFDEVDKAHPDVLTVLLQLFDDGRITDGQGKTVQCRRAIFVMTTNLVKNEISQQAKVLRKYLAPRDVEVKFHRSHIDLCRLNGTFEPQGEFSDREYYQNLSENVVLFYCPGEGDNDGRWVFAESLFDSNVLARSVATDKANVVGLSGSRKLWERGIWVTLKSDFVGSTDLDANKRRSDRRFMPDKVEPILKNHFKRDEFIGRINSKVLFLPFTDKELTQLAEIEVKKVILRAKQKFHIKVECDPHVMEKLKDDYEIQYGARSIKYAVERQILNKLSGFHAKGAIGEESVVKFYVEQDGPIQVTIENSYVQPHDVQNGECCDEIY
eukprot:459756_1